MQAVKSGRAIPPRLLEMPPLVQMGLEVYMQGFFDLAGDRQAGGRIPWSVVRTWCDAHGMHGDDADDAWFLLSRMDRAYMDWAKTKGKKLSEKGKEDREDGDPRAVRGKHAPPVQAHRRQR